MESEILNFSRIEDDPFAEIPLSIENSTKFSDTWQPSQATIILEYMFMVTQIVNFFLGVGAVIADTLLIYLILRYKRLRKHLNLYILHYSIMNLTHFLFAPISLLLHALIFARFTSFSFSYCLIYMSEISFLYMSFIFTLILAMEWTWSCYKPNFFKNPGVILKNKFNILYAYLAVQFILNIIGCKTGFEISTEFFFLGMPFIYIALIVMQYYRRKTVLNTDNLKSEYSLWVFTIAVGVFIPRYLLDLIFRFGPSSMISFIGIMLFYIEMLFSLLSTPGPIIIIYYMIQWNKHFKMAFDITFNRSVRTYGSDNLDEGSDNEEIAEEAGSKDVQNTINGGDLQNVLVP